MGEDPAPITVRTVENTNSPRDLRQPDGSWAWRRAMYFSVIGACLVLLGWIIFRRPLPDPILAIHVRYSYYTLWLGLLLYGAQGTLSELAVVIASFMSGKRITETVAPPPATVTTTAGGASSATSAPSVTKVSSDGDPTAFGGPRP